MRIAIVGTGGVGGYYGANLARSGAEVFFIARGQQYAAMREQGLRVESEAGPVKLEKVEVYEDPTLAPKADIALSCVKLYDAEAAAQICKSMLKTDGIAVSLQNGIDGPAFLSEVLGADRSVAGSVIISAFVESPACIKHVGSNQVFHIEKRSGLADELFRACIKAGFDAHQIEDPELLLWKKFVRLVPISGASVLCRSSMGFVASNPHLRRVLENLVRETVRVGSAKGVEFQDSVVEEVLERIDKAPYEFKPSLLLDIERGRKVEAPWLSGRVVSLGRELGIPTPYNDCAWAAVQRFVQ
ncbi:hypothetical protein BVY02_01560 [bacterium J17]|nr:hypothetical protein BVY02_01560 [bacterium J17]